MDNNKKFNKNLLLAILSISLGFLLFLAYQIMVLEPKGKPTEFLLQNEYNSINQLPVAKEVDHSSIVRLGLVLVQGTFITDANYKEIRNYYQQELPKHGWQFQGEQDMKVWGKDYGGKELRFNKGKFTLNLDYMGNDPESNFNYSIALSWE